MLFEEDMSAQGKATVEAAFHHAMGGASGGDRGAVGAGGGAGGGTGYKSGSRGSGQASAELKWKRVEFELPEWIDASAKNDNLVCNQRR